MEFGADKQDQPLFWENLDWYECGRVQADFL